MKNIPLMWIASLQILSSKQQILADRADKLEERGETLWKCQMKKLIQLCLLLVEWIVSFAINIVIIKDRVQAV